MNSYGVIFDMDGVLVDSYDAHLKSWQRTAQRFGLSMTEPDFARTFGRTSREIIAQLWPGRLNDEQIVEFDRQKEADYRDLLKSHFPEMDGAGNLLASLHQAGFALAIGSSGPAENVALIRSVIPNGQLISAAVHGGEVKSGKPDPQVFLLAAQKLGLEPRNCAVVEDAAVGVEAARRAGMTAIALVGTTDRATLQKRAHLVVDSLRQLSPQAIQQLIDTNR